MYLLIADPHLGLYSDSEMWHKITFRMYESAIDTCKRESIEKIIILGDFFDERKYLNIKTLDVALKIGKLLKDYQVFLIIGNHDVFYKDRLDPSSLELFGEFDNMTIVSEPYELDNLLLVPWQSPLPKRMDKYDAILGHFAINTFYTNDSYMYNSADAPNPDDFKNAKLVLSGHFHNPTRKGNIIYLGSPYQQRFGDSDTQRGYYILEDNHLELVEFRDAPKFVKIYSNERLERKRIEGNFVKLIYNRDYGKIQNNRIIENIQLLRPLQLHTDFTKMQGGTTQEKYTEDDIKLKNKAEIMSDYINKSEIPEHIKKGTLKHIIDRLMIEEEAE